MKHATALIMTTLVVFVSGCATAVPVAQADLNQIADKCHLDRSALQLQSNGDLRFQPASDAKFESVDCALDMLKKAKFPNMKMGFVGKERFETEQEK